MNKRYEIKAGERGGSRGGATVGDFKHQSKGTQHEDQQSTFNLYDMFIICIYLSLQEIKQTSV
jgi:hypothetical protein